MDPNLAARAGRPQREERRDGGEGGQADDDVRAESGEEGGAHDRCGQRRGDGAEPGGDDECGDRDCSERQYGQGRGEDRGRPVDQRGPPEDLPDLIVAGGDRSAANFVPVNDADNSLHLVLALGMIALGVLLTRDTRGRTTG